MLVRAMLDWCKAHGIITVALHPTDAARPLYESFGFQPTAEMRLQLPPRR